MKNKQEGPKPAGKKHRWRWLRKLAFMKYVVVAAAGVALVGFFGDNSMLAHQRNEARKVELQEEIRELRLQHKRATEKLRRLDTDPMAAEEVARERYFMKREDEDIFVLSGDKREQEYDYSDETTDIY